MVDELVLKPVGVNVSKIGAVSPNGRYVLASGFYKKFSFVVFDTRTGAQVSVVPAFYDEIIDHLTWAPDSKAVMATSTHALFLFNDVVDNPRDQPDLLLTVDAKFVAVYCAPNGLFFIADRTGAVVMWDFETRSMLTKLEFNHPRIDHASMTLVRTHFVMCSFGMPDGSDATHAHLDVVNVKTGKRIVASELYAEGDTINSVDVAQNGRTVVLVSGPDLHLVHLDATTHAPKKPTKIFDSKRIAKAMFSPDGRFLVCIAESPRTTFVTNVHVWDLETGRMHAQFDSYDYLLSFSPDSHYMFYSNPDMDLVRRPMSVEISALHVAAAHPPLPAIMSDEETERRPRSMVSRRPTIAGPNVAKLVGRYEMG